jgi:hypothetical protein
MDGSAVVPDMVQTLAEYLLARLYNFISTSGADLGPCVLTTVFRFAL